MGSKSPYWLFMLCARSKDYSQDVVDSVWSGLEESLRAPWRALSRAVKDEGKKAKREGREPQVVPAPHFHEEIIKRLDTLQSEWHPHPMSRVLESSYQECQHRYGDDFSVEDLLDMVDDNLL